MIGTPLRIYSEEMLQSLSLLADVAPVLFIQQTHDRTGSMAALRGALPRVDSRRFLEVPGDDHAYRDIDVLKDGIARWYRA